MQRKTRLPIEQIITKAPYSGMRISEVTDATFDKQTYEYIPPISPLELLISTGRNKLCLKDNPK